MKVVVVGLGYVGFSIATMLSENNNVVAIDINSSKIEKS